MFLEPALLASTATKGRGVALKAGKEDDNDHDGGNQGGFHESSAEAKRENEIDDRWLRRRVIDRRWGRHVSRCFIAMRRCMPRPLAVLLGRPGMPSVVIGSGRDGVQSAKRCGKRYRQHHAADPSVRGSGTCDQGFHDFSFRSKTQRSRRAATNCDATLAAVARRIRDRRFSAAPGSSWHRALRKPE